MLTRSRSGIYFDSMHKSQKAPPKECFLWSYQDSNLDLKFRKLPFYPLNYKTSLLRCEVLWRFAYIFTLFTLLNETLSGSPHLLGVLPS